VIEVDGAKVPVIGLDDLIQNKRAAGRPKDLLDLIELERIRRGG
jgi:predicted nucleotidyltransferase